MKKIGFGLNNKNMNKNLFVIFIFNLGKKPFKHYWKFFQPSYQYYC